MLADSEMGLPAERKTMALQIIGFTLAVFGGVGVFMGMRKKIDGDYIAFLYGIFIIGILLFTGGTILRLY